MSGWFHIQQREPGTKRWYPLCARRTLDAAQEEVGFCVHGHPASLPWKSSVLTNLEYRIRRREASGWVEYPTLVTA